MITSYSIIKNITNQFIKLSDIVLQNGECALQILISKEIINFIQWILEIHEISLNIRRKFNGHVQSVDNLSWKLKTNKIWVSFHAYFSVFISNFGVKMKYKSKFLWNDINI